MNFQQWHNDTLGKIAVDALKKNNFNAVYFPNSKEAIEYVMNFIDEGLTVGLAGSVTVKELKIDEKAHKKGAIVLDHNTPGLTPEEKIELRRKQLTCDIFLCSSNAITLDGALVNVDGAGNRIAAMTFGPKKVIVVAGMNKVCQDVDAAFERIKLIAAPQNNKRLNIPNPCINTGVCMDCQNKTRICNIYSVIRKKPLITDFNVVIIGENLGF
jgi:L-lactate utilization protein LutB